MISTADFHPMVVHFPIAIIIIGFLADVAGVFFKQEKCLTKMGYWLEIVGMIAAIGAFGTGYFFTSPMEGEAGVAREQHEFFATLTLITMILATSFRVVINYLKKEESRLKYLSLGLFLVGFVFVSITGFLGGRLVLDYMIGL